MILSQKKKEIRVVMLHNGLYSKKVGIKKKISNQNDPEKMLLKRTITIYSQNQS